MSRFPRTRFLQIPASGQTCLSRTQTLLPSVCCWSLRTAAPGIWHIYTDVCTLPYTHGFHPHARTRMNTHMCACVHAHVCTRPERETRYFPGYTYGSSHAGGWKEWTQWSPREVTLSLQSFSPTLKKILGRRTELSLLQKGSHLYRPQDLRALSGDSHTLVATHSSEQTRK